MRSCKKYLLSLLLVALVSGPTLAQRAASQLDELKREAFGEIDKQQVFTQLMVDQIFSYSELGFQEYETSKYVTAILEKNGFKIERGVAAIPTAWVATWGSGKPVIGFIADLDGIPTQSQKPGVAYRDPIIEGGPGHGEGHNAGQAVNVTAALALKKLMQKYKLSGTLKLFPGVAEELLATKAFLVREGLVKDVDVMLGSHVDSSFATSYGLQNIGLISVQYFFHGKSAHSASSPWRGQSALDAVELMNAGWNYRREHLPLEHRSHYVITNGGDQPNVVPPEATVWYFFRQADFKGIKELHDLGNTMAQAASMMTSTSVTQRILGSAWPTHFNKVVAEVQQKNIEMIGMPEWSEADQTLAKALQKEIGAKVEGLHVKIKALKGDAGPPAAGSDDIGDISWNVPTVYLRFPANIPNLPGHNWANGVAMATPIAHKGSTAGAKAQAATALDFLFSPDLVKQAWGYFNEIQTKEIKYAPLISAAEMPAVELNREKMEKFGPQLKKVYFDPNKYKTYLEQLGIRYPTVRN